MGDDVAGENRQKRRGRPSKEPTERKRGNLTFRVRDALRSNLEVAANQAGRSVSEEIELRLERSFEELDVVARALGGQTHADFIRAFALALQIVEAKAGKSWVSDPQTRAEVIVALSKIIRIRLFYNDDKWAEIMESLEMRREGIGALAAEIALGELAPGPYLLGHKIRHQMNQEPDNEGEHYPAREE